MGVSSSTALLCAFLAADCLPTGQEEPRQANDDSPEATIARGVVSSLGVLEIAFPRTDAPSSDCSVNREDPTTRYALFTLDTRSWCLWPNVFQQGEEVLHLPAIVEAAESSPPAAKEAATVIRKFLAKDNLQRAYVQYNSVMLIRILTDHPGKSFTRNVDSKFVAAVKDLLRDGRDMSVQQILRETLDTFEIQKADDETLAPLLVMWKKEKQKMAKLAGAVRWSSFPENALY